MISRFGIDLKKALALLVMSAPIWTCIANAQAKGLDEIQPRTPEEKAETTPATPSAAPTPATPAPGTTPPAAAGAAATATAVTTPEVKIEPSATSKAIADRLSLSTSFGLVRITKAKLGDFASQGGADLSLAWQLYKNASGSRALAVSLRYMPIHAENRIDGQSYKTIIEGFHLGSIYRNRAFTDRLFAFVSLELGYLLVYMDTRDRYPVSEDSEANELAFTVGTGLDWAVLDKFMIGPRFYAGFGDYQTMQFTLGASFVF